MGVRFRKSINLGGLRVNLSKSGIGYSVGGKGFRYTKKAGGGTRTTAFIPGTGVSYVKDCPSTSTDTSSNTGCLAVLLWPFKLCWWMFYWPIWLMYKMCYWIVKLCIQFCKKIYNNINS